MKKTSLIGFLIFIVLFFIAPFFVLAAPVGKITRIEGRVDVLKAGQRSVTPVSLGNAVDVGDIYRTKTDRTGRDHLLQQEHPQDSTGNEGAGEPVFG